VPAQADDDALEHLGGEVRLVGGEQDLDGLLELGDGLERLGGVVEQAGAQEHQAGLLAVELGDAFGEVEAGLVERVLVADPDRLAHGRVGERDLALAGDGAAQDEALALEAVERAAEAFAAQVGEVGRAAPRRSAPRSGRGC
jgi:hypothetical protein